MGTKQTESGGHFKKYAKNDGVPFDVKVGDRTIPGVAEVQVGTPCGLVVFRDTDSNPVGSAALSSPRISPEDITVIREE